MSETHVARLGVVDDMFWRTHHGLGPTVVMQGIWRIDAHIPVAALVRAHAALAAGPLNRVVRRARIPFARRYFVTTTRVAPIHREPGEIDDVLNWADRMARRPIDVDEGPVWELSLAHETGGATTISLVCSHLVADGRTMLDLAAAALHESTTPGPSAQESITQGSGARGPAAPGVADDVTDALSQLAALGRVARTIVRGVTDRHVRRELLSALPSRAVPLRDGPTRSAPGRAGWREPTQIVDFDVADWDEAATRHGGSSTALLAAIAGCAAGVLRETDDVEVAIPIARRADAHGPRRDMASPADGGMRASCRDARSEALSAAVVRTPRPPSADLTSIERQLRDARECLTGDPAAQRTHRSPAFGPPAGMPPQLLHLVGDRIAHRLIPDPGAGDALASVLHSDADAFSPDALTGGRAASLFSRIAVRAVYPRLTAATADQTRMSLRAWMIRNGSVVTVAFCAPDVQVVDATDLANVIEHCAKQWGLTPTPW